MVPFRRVISANRQGTLLNLLGGRTSDSAVEQKNGQKVRWLWNTRLIDTHTFYPQFVCSHWWKYINIPLICGFTKAILLFCDLS